jgi:hypothetical protein
MEQRLRRMVFRWLESLGEQASCADPGQLGHLARGEIRRLTDGWRRLLTEHQPDEDGRCPQCPGWPRNRPWPCHVWRMAHHHLVGEAGLISPLSRVRPAAFGRRRATIVPRQRPPRRGPAGPTITAVPTLPPTPARTTVAPTTAVPTTGTVRHAAPDPARPTPSGSGYGTAHAVQPVEPRGTRVHRAPVLTLPH